MGWIFIVEQYSSPVAGAPCTEIGCGGEVIRNIYSLQAGREIIIRTGGPHCSLCGLAYSKTTPARMVEVPIIGEP